MSARKPTVENYVCAVPSAPPKGGEEWIREHGGWERNYLIYRDGRYTDPITELSGKCVRARCTACGNDMVLDYVAGPQCGGYATAPFGFRLWEGGSFHDYCSNESLMCPECGAKVTSLHIQRVTRAYSEERYWMTVSSIPVGMGNPASLCLSFWRTEKEFSKEGTYRFYTVPWEAYVFDAWDRVVRLAHWQAGMYAGQRYYITGFRQTRRAQDTIRDVYFTYGDIAAALPGTACQESKLDLYMRAETPFPVSYLRLWQKHKQAEAILTSGGGRFLGALMEDDKRRAQTGGYGYASNHVYNNLFCDLEYCDWTKTRPSGILRMHADEYRTLTERPGTENAVAKWVQCRAHGMELRADRDWEAVERFTARELRELREHGEAPMKALRYLDGQRKRYGDGEVSMSTLTDYWNMAGNGEPYERWPQNLRRAHDQALLRQKFREQEKLRKLFEERYEHCKRFEFEADGLTVIAPRCEGDLIAEGKILHHCVASYAERHAKGLVTVLFVRRIEAPEVPYYTLSFYEADGHLCMNHGLRNCDETKEMKAFREKWEKWRDAGCKREEKRTA